MKYKVKGSLTTEKKDQIADSVLTVREVAEYLKVSDKTIYRICKKGEIPFSKIEGQYRFMRSRIEQWLEGDVNE